MKIILLGNAGSGKSTLARRLIAAAGHDVARLPLDEIAWNEGVERKPIEESRQLLLQFVASNEHWIVEGCYADIVEAALPFCTELCFLNPGVETCVRHCRSRPWEPEKFASPEDQQAMLDHLVDWVRSYEIRTDEYGLARHRALFDAYAGSKREFTNAADYAAG